MPTFLFVPTDGRFRNLATDPILARMFEASATALRLGLHLLLAACLLLQASTALALSTRMAGTATAAAAPAPVEATSAPPCHRATPEARPTSIAGDAAQAVDRGQACCDAASGLCDWACTQAPHAGALPGLVVLPARFPALGATIPSTRPSWPVSTPLRPPAA